MAVQTGKYLVSGATPGLAPHTVSQALALLGGHALVAVSQLLAAILIHLAIALKIVPNAALLFR